MREARAQSALCFLWHDFEEKIALERMKQRLLQREVIKKVLQKIDKGNLNEIYFAIVIIQTC